MRVQIIDYKAPDYVVGRAQMQTKVYLDGEFVRHCVEAQDGSEGYVVCRDIDIVTRRPVYDRQVGVVTIDGVSPEPL